MVLALLVFVLVAGLVLGAYAAYTYLPDIFASRKLDQRLREVSMGGPAAEIAADKALL